MYPRGIKQISRQSRCLSERLEHGFKCILITNALHKENTLSNIFAAGKSGVTMTKCFFLTKKCSSLPPPVFKEKKLTMLNVGPYGAERELWWDLGISLSLSFRHLYMPEIESGVKNDQLHQQSTVRVANEPLILLG